MDENLDYGTAEDIVKTETSTNWQLGHGSAFSLEKHSSRLFLQFQNYHLHLIQKKGTPPIRPTIPTTLQDRLAYYRNYVSSPSKTQKFFMQHTNFTRFFWNYILIVFFKSLPHTFVHIFLASYVPEEHLFIPKMVPFLYGSKFASVLASISELLAYIDNCVILAGYTIHGLLYTSPWNRCPNGTTLYGNQTMNCYGIREFAEKVKNSTWSYRDGVYVTDEGEYFQFVQIIYLRYYNNTMTNAHLYAYFITIWILVAVLQKQVYRRRFWKALTIIQWSVMTVDFITFLYLIHSYFHESIDTPKVEQLIDPVTEVLWSADIDMLAESMTTPPVLHIITARSNQEINPSKDSTIIILSNALMYVFKGLLTNILKAHCERIVGAPIQFRRFDQLSWFYMWPLFFSKFYLGDLYIIVYLILNFAMEFLTIIVTYSCLVEIIIWEWTRLKRWMVTAFIVFGIPLIFILTINVNESHIEFHIFCKVTVTCAEVLILYCMYPLGRLVDDITFHCGTSPTRLRVLNLRIVPIFYFIKTYLLMDGMIKLLLIFKPEALLSFKYYGFIVMMPYVLGLLYITCIYVIREKSNWKRMFIPHEDWGPSDFVTRQLRKKYDSRNYIGSQAPKDLSRYLIGKLESKSYQLDIQYDPSRRSTIPTFAYHRESEKKNI